MTAGLFDAIVATLGAIHGGSLTANLTIDYRRPVPLRRLLRMEAVVDRIVGVRCHVSLVCSMRRRFSRKHVR